MVVTNLSHRVLRKRRAAAVEDTLAARTLALTLALTLAPTPALTLTLTLTVCRCYGRHLGDVAGARSGPRRWCGQWLLLRQGLYCPILVQDGAR